MNEVCYGDLMRLNQELDWIYHRLAREIGLSDSGLSVFYALCQRNRPTAPSELYADWSLSKQTGHSALLALERQGLVALSPDPGDGRGKLVELTEAGRAYARRAIAPMMEAEQVSFDRLTRSERQQLVALTRKSMDLLKQELAVSYAAEGADL